MEPVDFFIRLTFEIIPYHALRLVSFRAGPRSTVGSAPDSSIRGPGFDTRSGHILSCLLPLIQEGQLSVSGESMCTKYWLTVKEVSACPGKVWLG